MRSFYQHLVLAALACQGVDKATALIHQHFDGPGPGLRVEGRAEWRDSAVGGKALVFNGVDTRATIDVPPISLALWFFASEPAAMTLAERGWTLSLEADGSIKAGTIQTRPNRWFAGQWVHVALTPSALYVNGMKEGDGELLAGNGPLVLGGSGKTAFRGLVDELCAFGKPAEIPKLAEALPWYAPRPRQQPFTRFELAPGEGVAFLGGENLAAERLTGYLESQLTLAAKGAFFRSLAWEGDTVFEQKRDFKFGDVRRSLARAGATVAILQFGQMESLRGDVAAFKEAYDRLLADVQEQTKRIVILSPTPFEKKAPPLPDLSGRNRDLTAYVDVCRDLAARRQALFVDLSGVAAGTRDGVHLNDAGQKAVASAVVKALGLEERPVPTDLRTSILEKNRLWHGAWRPMNWAFLEGDRTEQPSSREHEDRRVRWFPVEMQDYLPLLLRAEERIRQ